MAVKVVKRAYKYRFYPTREQKQQLACTFGCVRYVYNRAPAERSRAWTQEQRRISHAETDKMLTAWKRDPDTEWLTEPSKGPLQAPLRNLQGAFEKFWRKQTGYPKFKKKGRSKDSATYSSNCFTYRNGRIKLAKQSEPLDIVWSRPLPEGAVPSQVTASRDGAGRYVVSILVEESVREHAPVDAALGVDAGITSLCTFSTGEKVSNPRHEMKDRARLAKAQRALFRAMLEYKADWYGRTVVAADRFYPSSKTCSACGRINNSMPLQVREWECPCGARHDRDVNAAKNILAAGLAVQACGDGMRPPRS